MFNKIGILGLGLIGGSIARALKKYNYPTTIYGYNRNQESLAQAVESGSIDIGVSDFKDFSDCDLIILCCPVKVNLILLEQLLPFLKENVIISDVGSTKSDIHVGVQTFSHKGYFIGGHPMAGSEKSGFSATKAELFENAYYVLTPEEGTPQSLIEEMQAFATSLKAIPIVLEPKLHDSVVASISHVPHILASALVNLVEETDTESQLMYTLAAGGFKDFTRIAASSPDMWQQICIANKDSIVHVLDQYIEAITTIKEDIINEQEDDVYALFEDSRRYRNTFQNRVRGSIEQAHALFLNISDVPGIIAEIASLLCEASLSIKNIGINNNREDFEGILEILFYDEESLFAGKELLIKANYDVIDPDYK